MSLKTTRRAATLKAALKAAAPKRAAPKPAAQKAAPKNVATAVALRSRAATMQGLNPQVVAALSGRGRKIPVPQSSFAPPPPPFGNPRKGTHDDARNLRDQLRPEVPSSQVVLRQDYGARKVTDPGTKNWCQLPPKEPAQRSEEPRRQRDAARAVAEAARALLARDARPDLHVHPENLPEKQFDQLGSPTKRTGDDTRAHGDDPNTTVS